MQANPRDVRIYISLASLLETPGEWQQAEGLYKKALAMQPDYPIAANNLSYLMLGHGGDVIVALTLAQTARKGLPDLPSTADTLGWTYYNQGACSSSLDTLQEAVKQNPDSATYTTISAWPTKKPTITPWRKENSSKPFKSARITPRQTKSERFLRSSNQELTSVFVFHQGVATTFASPFDTRVGVSR